jgi:hypothetical protein
MIDAASYALHGPGLPLAKPEWVDQEVTDPYHRHDN